MTNCNLSCFALDFLQPYHLLKHSSILSYGQDIAECKLYDSENEN